jgi:hypothetical protein
MTCHLVLLALTLRKSGGTARLVPTLFKASESISKLDLQNPQFSYPCAIDVKTTTAYLVYSLPTVANLHILALLQF